jgi:hypothetical protein
VLILFQRGNTRGHECLKSNTCVNCVSTWQYTCHACLQLRPYDLQQNNPTADTELIIVSEERQSVATENGHEPAKTKRHVIYVQSFSSTWKETVETQPPL